jgi:hypothetical protein
MIEEILVDSKLLPVREAAQNGNLDALFTLSKHIMENDRARLSTKNLRALSAAIASHEDFGKTEDPRQIVELCKIMADYYWCLYQEGGIDGETAREEMRIKYQELIYFSAQLDFADWDITTMKNCMDWLAADAFEPIHG